MLAAYASFRNRRTVKADDPKYKESINVIEKGKPKNNITEFKNSNLTHNELKQRNETTINNYIESLPHDEEEFMKYHRQYIIPEHLNHLSKAGIEISNVAGFGAHKVVYKFQSNGKKYAIQFTGRWGVPKTIRKNFVEGIFAPVLAKDEFTTTTGKFMGCLIMPEGEKIDPSNQQHRKLFQNLLNEIDSRGLNRWDIDGSDNSMQNVGLFNINGLIKALVWDVDAID